jgi:hypothetical protein
MSSVNIKTIISKQIPNFVQEDHQGLQQFLEAYYDYVDKFVKRDIASLRDLDNTLDEFVLYIKNELDIFGDSDYQYIDKILLLRKIKQVLVSKGSETAYKFLFKILYDKPVNISYPWDSVLKVSDGKWKRDTSLFIRITQGSPLEIAGSRVSIVGQQRIMYVYVDNIRHVEDDVFEFFIEKSYYGIIEIGDELVYNGVKGTILPTTVNYEIVNPGQGYQVGDVINSSTFANNKTITQRLKVTGVDNNGGIKSLITLRFGYDYTSEFFLFTSNEQAVRKSRFALTREGVPQFDIPDNTEVEQYQDYGQVSLPNYWVTTFSKINYTGTLLQQFYTQTLNNLTDPENFSLIRFKIGAVAKYQGYYYSNDGFLSDNIYLQDSKYYQKYSYLVTIDERLEDYKALLKSFIHPAGVALFGEYQIQNNFTTNISTDFRLDEYTSKTTTVTINRAVNDTTLIGDTGGYVDMNPYDLEGYILRTPNSTDRYNIGNFTEKDSENTTLITINPS